MLCAIIKSYENGYREDANVYCIFLVEILNYYTLYNMRHLSFIFHILLYESSMKSDLCVKNLRLRYQTFLLKC